MIYHSTRDKNLKMDSAQAVLEGLAPDGGLMVPESLPSFDWQDCLKGDTLSMAKKILSALLPDVENMDTLVENAYRGKFSKEDLTPTVQVGNFRVLELFHGPTAAFKDVALCMLPHLLVQAKTQKGVKEDILILTATSGDTGKAALVGFADVPGVKICVFYPDGGVSRVQRAQMVTQKGNNVTVSGVNGNFDDAQTGVKKIFAASENNILPGTANRLSTANSMNIGRLAPQVMYYFKAYTDLMKAGKIKLGDKVNYSVPTGNFGDILAGYLAKQLGLPVGTLLCASNANNVLTDFLQTGCYDRRRPLHKTISPSLDILVSSNLERLLYFISQDAELVKGYMEKLNAEGVYEVTPAILNVLKEQFYPGYCTDEKAQEVIGRVWAEKKYLCDTHTACAWAVAEDYVNQTGDKTPMVVLSTASPYKFPTAVLGALEQTELTDEFRQMERLHALTGVEIPKNLTGLEEATELHTGVCNKEDMLALVRKL